MENKIRDAIQGVIMADNPDVQTVERCEELRQGDRDRVSRNFLALLSVSVVILVSVLSWVFFKVQCDTEQSTKIRGNEIMIERVYTKLDRIEELIRRGNR